MLRIALKDLFARKRRLVTTGLAIALGIAFLTGTQLLSGALTDSIDELIGDVYEGIDAVVRSPDAQQTPFGQAVRSGVPEELVDEVAGVDGVAGAEGFIEATGPQLIDADGLNYGGSGLGPPTLVYNWVDDDRLRTGALREGRGPEAADEIVLDFNSAEDLELGLGDRVTVATLQDGERRFELVGIIGLGSDGTKSTGAKPMFFTTPVAQELVDLPGQFSFVAVAAADGIGQEEIARRLATALPDLQVLTGEALTEENREAIAEFVDLLGLFVSVFGYIALFVAVFIIYNTFSIIVTQRTRETALLRAVGARRRQVLAATMVEAVVVGLVAGVLGVVLGLLLAILLLQVVGTFFTITGTVPPLTVTAVASALGVGVLVTVLSAVLPALRSSRVPPIAALSEASVDRSDLSLARRVGGVALLAAGGALVAWGLSLPDVEINPIVLVGAGAAAILLSVATVLGPLIAAPVSRVLSGPVTLLSLSRDRTTARLAGENAARSPKRTAATAAALTIGVTLVVVIAIIASSIRESVDATIRDTVRADWIIATSSVTSLGRVPADIRDRVQDLPEVAMTSPTRFGLLRLRDEEALADPDPPSEELEGLFGQDDTAPEGQDEFVLGIDPDTWFEVIDNGELQGSPDDLREGTMAVSRSFAEDRGWRLGDEIPVWFGATGETELTVEVVYERETGQPPILLPLATFEPNMLPIFNVDSQIYVVAAEGVEQAELGAELREVLEDAPTALVQDLQAFIDAQTLPIDVFLNIVYALLGLAIFIALIGITNTLSLSVMERTRELGLLRAVGMSRRQLRRMVRVEAAIIALLGTGMGLVIGIGLSLALMNAVSSSQPGLFTYSLPVGQLVVICVTAAVAGIVAAWIPARRAARLDVLDAISSV